MSKLARLLVLLAASVIAQGCAEKVPTTPAEILERSFSTGDWETTITICKQRLKTDPNNTDLLSKLGQAHLATKEYKAAIANFTKWIELQPDEADPYYFRESAHEALGHTQLAYKDGQTGRSLDPLYKSAYAYDPSNFVPPIQLSSEPIPGDERSDGDGADDRGPDSRDADEDSNDPNTQIAEDPYGDNSDNDAVANNGEPNRTPYEETVFSDETGFVPNETSRVLANGRPQSDAPSADAGDIGIPKVPEIVRENRIPKLNMNGAGPIAPNADGRLAEFKDIRFPAVPTDESPEEMEVPDTIIVPQKISSALPTDEFGNIRFPDAAQTGLSTGLPNNFGNATGGQLLSPSGIPIGNSGPIATGLNAPSADTAGQATNPLVPGPGNFDPKFNNIPGLSGVNGQLPTGLSGLPIPNGSTGLPTGRFPTAATPNAVGNRAGFAPNGQFRGNPIYGQGNQPAISTNLQGYTAPNGVPANNAVPNGAPATGTPATGAPVPAASVPRISTSLPDSVLQNRLQSAPPQSLQLRSLQPQ